MFDMISGTITTTDTTSRTTSDTVAYYTYRYKVKCEKCDGTGYQQRDDGIFVVCPICDGGGWREQKRECEPVPPEPHESYHPWERPTYNVPQRRKYIITC